MRARLNVFLAFFILAFFLAPPVSATVVSIDVKEVLNGRSSFFEFRNESILEFKQDWENTGSIDCNIQMRLDIKNESGTAATVWSRKIALAPGDNTLLEAYCVPELTGDYEAEMILYYCNNLIPFRNISFTYNKPEFAPLNLSLGSSSDETTITFDIVSDKNLTGLKIVPLDYPKTWIFPAMNIGNVRAGEKKTVVLDYEPVVWMPRNMSFAFVSGEGYFEERLVLGAGEKKDYTVTFLVIVLVLSIIANLYAFFVLQRKNSGVSVKETRPGRSRT